ncbi:MAG: HAMP domain-containing sensor histidine kinase [Myxococcota bacterium]
MGDSTAFPPRPLQTRAIPGLPFGEVRPVLAAGTLEELGRVGLDVVHHIAPRATGVFGWQFAGWNGPVGWRRGPRDTEPRVIEAWQPPHHESHRGLVTFERAAGEGFRHGLWVPVGPDPLLGSFEVRQRDPFDAHVVDQVASVAEAVTWSAARLRDRQRMLDEQRQIRATVDARTNFFAQMSHELRTPLNAILGYVELIREDRDHITMDEVVDDLSRVHASARHLLGLVDDILDLAKAERGKAEIGRARVSVTEVVEELDDVARPLMATEGNRWVVECPADLFVWGDARRLYQVLVNLVSNAAKFTSHGEVRLVVRRYGSDVTMTVIDSGIGMSSDRVKRIFEPFEQVHDDKRSGTGLGLAIAAQYVHQMGGAIDVQSELGLGSRFVVTLAAAEGPADDA